ncbi:hypothetical protein NX059_011759 [Plenodomus lindquistii]|nr:hypothetical protein NX059_011759 [Plenodomus lindquistii]
MDAFNILGTSHPITLSIIASSLSPVSTSTSGHTTAGSSIGQSIVPTHTFETAPKNLDVLLIPGGNGACDEDKVEVLDQCVQWLKSRDVGREKGPKWVLTVCTGSEILARTGGLDGRRATTNKRDFNNVGSFDFYPHTFLSPLLSFVEKVFLTLRPDQSQPSQCKVGCEGAMDR